MWCPVEPLGIPIICTCFLLQILGGSDDDALTAFSLYRNKKLLTQSMMDIALFSSNANQLRNVLEANDGQAISIICIALLLFSIILQVITCETTIFDVYIYGKPSSTANGLATYDRPR